MWRSARRCGWALTRPVTVAGRDQPGGGAPRHTPPLAGLNPTTPHHARALGTWPEDSKEEGRIVSREELLIE